MTEVQCAFHAYDARMQFGTAIAQGLNVSVWYADVLVKGIPADKFSHMPQKDFNSPAFCLGHLSIYPARVLAMLGRQDLVVPNPAGWEDLFKAGVQCVDEPGKYPGKDAIVEHWSKGCAACDVALKSVSNAVLEEANPAEGRMKEMFPTKGAAVNFLCVGHPSVHLGQISMWRRAMGLGSAV